jgi:type II secretory pathway component GspD/PulD (secretin)
MSRNLLVAGSALLCTLVFLRPSAAQGLQPPPAEEKPNAERRLETLQKEVEVLTKELERVRNIARLTEPTPKPDTLTFVLKYNKAIEVAKVLQELFGNANKTFRLAVDEKANTIHATGPADQLAMVQAALKDLDRPAEKPKTAGDSPKPDFQVLKLKHVEAASIANTIQSLFPDGNKAVRVVAEPLTNTLLIQASPADLTKVLGVIEKLDVEKKATSIAPEKSSWKIFTLKRAEAVDMATLLTKLFPRDQVRLAADPRSNSLVVFARTDDLMTIEAILSRLEEATEKKVDILPTPRQP